MSILDLFRPVRSATSLWDSEAVAVMRRFNPNALIAEENGDAVFIEDHWDSDTDRRTYRLEYRSRLDGRGAVAFCLRNPWSRGGDPTAGVCVSEGHVFHDGLLCLSSEHARSPRSSSMALADVIKRARFWCTGFSCLKETGEFPNL